MKTVEITYRYGGLTKARRARPPMPTRRGLASRKGTEHLPTWWKA